MKILLVDDEESIVDALTELLEIEHEVTATADSEEALELLRDNEYSVLITDYNMPTVTGKELADFANTKSIRTVIITGNTELTFREDYIKTVHKPMNFKDLNNTVKAIWE